jgi:hypothetical protein
MYINGHDLFYVGCNKVYCWEVSTHVHNMHEVL